MKLSKEVKDDIYYHDAEDDSGETYITISQQIIADIEDEVDITNEIEKMNEKIRNVDEKSLFFGDIPIVQNMSELLMHILEQLSEQEACDESINLIHDIFVFLQIVIRNDAIEQLIMESGLLTSLIPAISLKGTVLSDVAKLLSIFIVKRQDNISYVVDNSIVKDIIEFIEASISDCKQAALFNYPDIFKFFYTLICKNEDDSLLEEIAAKIIEIHALLMKVPAKELGRLSDTINILIQCETMMISKSISFIDLLLESSVLQGLNALISNAAYSNLWRSIIKMNVNILSMINSDDNNEEWTAVVSSLDADTLFCIFLQQPFEDYSQETLKLLNNLIVDVPELAAQVPNDFIEIFIRCLGEFTSEQSRNALRLCFGVIYNGNDEFTNTFIEEFFPFVPSIILDNKELQDYFCLSFARVLQQRESTPELKTELINRINEVLGDSLSEWAENGSEKALELVDYLEENDE